MSAAVRVTVSSRRAVSFLALRDDIYSSLHDVFLLFMMAEGIQQKLQQEVEKFKGIQKGMFIESLFKCSSCTVCVV